MQSFFQNTLRRVRSQQFFNQPAPSQESIPPVPQLPGKSQVTTTVTPISSTRTTMEALLAQAQALAKTVDETGRKKLIDGLRDLAVSLEDTQESAQRLLYSPLPLMALRFGCDVKLFNILVDAGKPLTVAEIATKTGVAPKLMARMLRYMASVRIIKETDTDIFVANNVTKTFTIEGFQGGVYHYFDYVGPGVKHLPDFLKTRGYKDIESVTDCPLPKAWGSDLPTFLHYQTQPELFGWFNKYMGAQRMGMPTWLDAYPYKKAVEGLAPERPFFVDVGGGFGHQTIGVREALPNVPNKFILQDIPATLEHAIKHPGVEIQVQDFFTPQQTKGAKIYYMRNILHDYPDDKAVEILKNTKEALGPDSVILIDDMYLGTKNVHWQAAQLDLTMMVCLSSIERTEEQWKELIPKAGLKIQKVYKYTQSLGDAIIEVVPAERF